MGWPKISWISSKYIRIVEDTENHNHYFSKAFGFLFVASASYAVFQSVVIFFKGYDSFIVGMTLNTSATLFMLSILSPCMFGQFLHLWVSKKVPEIIWQTRSLCKPWTMLIEPPPEDVGQTQVTVFFAATDFD